MRERIFLILSMLAAFALRFWGLDRLGLGYDEAATALMARATAGEIVLFHWTAAFEHPPLWQLSMHAWSALAGQSELALRFVSAGAGVLAIPLTWTLLKSIFVRERSVRMLAAAFVTVAPVLVFYSQEARMYSVVVALALTSLYLGACLLRQPSWLLVGAFALVNWVMTGFHYYSALLIAAEGVGVVLVLAMQPRLRRRWKSLAAALLISGAPVMLWMITAPGFRQTAGQVLASSGETQTSLFRFLDGLWRDLTFGAIRWQPETAIVGFLILPLLLLGLAYMLHWIPAKRGPQAGGNDVDFGWYLAAAFVVPIVLALPMYGSLKTRYILYVVPILYSLVAFAVVFIWRINRAGGAILLIVAVIVSLTGLNYYYGPYVKSDYRSMAVYLESRMADSDAILLEAPRQHLLAKYYLDSDRPMYAVPNVDMPDYWPLNAPPLVPEEVDDDIQAYLRRYPSLWLIRTAQDEVDPGEFLTRYLTAVSYRTDCRTWLNVDLCRYVSPHFVEAAGSVSPGLMFADELLLENVTYSVLEALPGNDLNLLVQLDWLAQRQPSADYKVSLRLVDDDQQVVALSDDYPIGPLLPPTTWSEGDRKSGYMALSIPAGTRPGSYALTVSLYDPATLESVGYVRGDDSGGSGPVVLVGLHIDGGIEFEE